MGTKLFKFEVTEIASDNFVITSDKDTIANCNRDGLYKALTDITRICANVFKATALFEFIV